VYSHKRALRTAFHRPVSSSQNPWPGPDPVLPPDLPPQPVLYPSDAPLWSGWDVVQLAVLTMVSVFVLLLLTAAGVQRLFHPRQPLVEVVKHPLVTVLAQTLAYVFVFGYMVAIVKKHGGSNFWSAIRWNWPAASSLAFLGAGALLYVVLTAFSQALPIPKHLPIDQFFQTAGEAALMTMISVTVAPLMEELFFRGFLYPVLARRLGASAGVFLTALLFGLLHGAQLGYSWAVLIIFLVGLALTIVRAVTGSVASSFLVHVGYNGTLSAILFFATGGFRHLEKLTQ